jgi:hypothetical protein
VLIGLCRSHIDDFITAYKFGRRLKTANGRSPDGRHLRNLDGRARPIYRRSNHQMVGLNTYAWAFSSPLGDRNGPERGRGFADSPLEEDGFELSVPGFQMLSLFRRMTGARQGSRTPARRSDSARPRSASLGPGCQNWGAVSATAPLGPGAA